MRLAHINITIPKYELDAPEIADFVNNLDVINALAARSPGFIELIEDGPEYAIYNSSEILATLSLWQSFDELFHFVYMTAHKKFLARKAEWMKPHTRPHMALWWVADDHRPDLKEAEVRLLSVEKEGSTPKAFDFKSAFDQKGNPIPKRKTGVVDRQTKAVAEVAD